MKKKHTVLKIILAVLLCGISVVGYKIWQFWDNSRKYMGHGFDYMHGYSTTDFTGYHVYDGEKLVTLDHKAAFTIENEADMPVFDGAEACYPVYTALAKAVYKDIDKIEAGYKEKAENYWNNRGTSKDYDMLDIYLNNGRIVTFSNTVQAYERLTDGIVDLVIAARPSANQKQAATEKLEQIMTLPIGKEAFIFFVEEDNPVDNLTSEQIRGIYHGDITNWKELGGKNQKIIAFQRPEDSGSQVMMKWFMGDVTLQEPKKFEYVGGMGDIISKVAEYNNEKGAIGYTFKYFLTGLNQETHVKILSVDGIEPTAENIKNGTYPATVSLVCAYLASNQKETVKQMLDFMLSDDGQYIIEQTGYRRLTDRNVTARAENEIEAIDPAVYVSEDGNWTMSLYRKNNGEIIGRLEGKGINRKGYMWYYGDRDKTDDWPYQFELMGKMQGFGLKYDGETDSYIIGDAYGNSSMNIPVKGTVLIRKQ